MADDPASTANTSYAAPQPTSSSHAQTLLATSPKTRFSSDQPLDMDGPVKRWNDHDLLPTKGGKYLSSTSARSESNSNAIPGKPLPDYAPLTLSAGRWVPITHSAEHPADPDSPENVDRKVKGLLNKLTDKSFDGISDQIIMWANKSEVDQDARILRQVTRLIFEHAVEDEARSEIYARLCRKASEQTSNLVRDEASMNMHGNPITGGQLFRKYLLNWCQDTFERLFTAENEVRSSLAIALYSDEYYATRQAKRQGLGLARFTGELFKLKLLTERIIHECIKRLLVNVQNPGEAQIEFLCKLLVTVGSILDTGDARAYMDVYISRMKELTRGPILAPRIRFMFQVNSLLSPPAVIVLPARDRMRLSFENVNGFLVVPKQWLKWTKQLVHSNIFHDILLCSFRCRSTDCSPRTIISLVYEYRCVLKFGRNYNHRLQLRLSRQANDDEPKPI
jgi:hypothetical protein